MFKAILKPTQHSNLASTNLGVAGQAQKMTGRSQLPSSYNEGNQMAGNWTPLHSLYEDLEQKHTALLQTQVPLGGEKKEDTLSIENMLAGILRSIETGLIQHRFIGDVMLIQFSD